MFEKQNGDNFLPGFPFLFFPPGNLSAILLMLLSEYSYIEGSAKLASLGCLNGIYRSAILALLPVPLAGGQVQLVEV